MDMIQVEVCAERHRKDGSNLWDQVACRVSAKATNRSSVMKAWDYACDDGSYYRTAAQWSGIKDWWSGKSYDWARSDSSARC